MILILLLQILSVQSRADSAFSQVQKYLLVTWIVGGGMQLLPCNTHLHRSASWSACQSGRYCKQHICKTILRVGSCTESLTDTCIHVYVQLAQRTETNNLHSMLLKKAWPRFWTQLLVSTQSNLPTTPRYFHSWRHWRNPDHLRWPDCQDPGNERLALCQAVCWACTGEASQNILQQPGDITCVSVNWRTCDKRTIYHAQQMWDCLVLLNGKVHHLSFCTGTLCQAYQPSSCKSRR